MQFFSDEWAKSYCKGLNENPDYEVAAKKWEGDFVFIADDKEGNVKYQFYIDLWHGKCRKAHGLDPNEKTEAEFILKGPYENWVLVGKGELDPIQGIMVGKFRLIGNMATIMRFPRAATEMVNTIGKIATDF